MGVKSIRVESEEMRKVLNQIINQAQMIIGINRGKLYPVAAKDLVIREINPKV
jgi:hypothetical protein